MEEIEVDEFGNKIKRVKLGEGGFGIIIVEASQEYLDKLKMEEEASKVVCPYCSEKFNPEDLEGHKRECKKTIYSKLKTVEEKLAFMEKELGLI